MLASLGRTIVCPIRSLTQEDPLGLAGGLNLYGFAGGDPVTFTDPFGLMADTVKVQVHEVKVAGVKTGDYHASIRITPNNQERWKGDPRFSKRDAQGRAFVTLGAEPSGPGRLVSSLDRPTDVAANQTSAVVPTPGGEDAAIESLLQGDANYKDDAVYTFFPETQGGYNSNSYVAGILQAAGLHRPVFPLSMPGYVTPLPANYFQP